MSDSIGKLLPSESALLIGQKAVSKFKVIETITVRALERLQSMLQRGRVGAEAEGLKPDQLEKLYQALVNHLIAEEMRHWKQSRKE